MNKNKILKLIGILFLIISFASLYLGIYVVNKFGVELSQIWKISPWRVSLSLFLMILFDVIIFMVCFFVSLIIGLELILRED